jgi:hypothetical protein
VACAGQVTCPEAGDLTDTIHDRNRCNSEDDASIGRFIEMLHSMMDRTQFIIITHSRKTMEIAK